MQQDFNTEVSIDLALDSLQLRTLVNLTKISLCRVNLKFYDFSLSWLDSQETFETFSFLYFSAEQESWATRIFVNN